MKKFLALVLCLMLLCIASTAMAAEYNPGDTVTVKISVTGGNTANCRIKVTADTSIFSFVSAQVVNVNGTAPNDVNKNFVIKSPDYPEPLSGQVAEIVLKISDAAEPGKTYNISISANSCVAADANGMPVKGEISISGTNTNVKIAKPACEHEWDNGVETTAPTCTTAGEMTYTCSKCGETKTEDIEALGHEYDMANGVVTKEPTCVDPGVKTFYCKNDKTHTITDPVPATEKHEWVESIIKPANCTDAGEKLLKCSVCGEEDPQTIPAKGHTPSDTAVRVEPTCTENGSISYNCTVCGEQVDGEVLEAIGHEWDEGKITTAPACGKKGVKTFTCKHDASHTKTEDVAALEHVWDDGAVTTEPACGKKGEKTFTCKNGCGETKTEEIAALEHVWDDGVITTEPACGKKGEKTFTCKNGCGETKTEEIAALEHKWDDGTITTAPTCVDEGEKTFKCLNNCGETKTEKVDATGIHTPGTDAVIVKPTCTEPGSETYNCTVCGTKVDGKVIPAIGHDWGEWVVTTDPTCTKKGEQTATCKNDASHTKTESVKATGVHIWDEGKVTTEPTCTKDGKKTFTCTYGCGKTKTETVAKLGHDYDDGVVTTPATCTKDGVKTYTCKNDANHTKTEKINKLGHDYDDGVVTTEPTCTKDGEKTYTCKNDASHTKTEKIDKLGHEWGEWVVTKPLTEKEDGEQQRTCGRCGEVETKVISHRADYYMTVCSAGIRFRDLENPLTNEWYMFTPIDLSVEGEQTFDLVAGNIHVIGKVTVLVQDGNVTVDYQLFNGQYVYIYEEFMTILPSLSSIEELDFETLTAYEFGAPISIEETLGGDTKVLLLLRNRAMYKEGAKGVDLFKGRGEDYEAFVEELKLVMD